MHRGKCNSYFASQIKNKAKQMYDMSIMFIAAQGNNFTVASNAQSISTICTVI